MTDLSVRKKLAPYKVTHKVRFVTAASLFDGHDASINIMRRILQASGAEVIHLGHNRSVAEVVNAALQEDVQGIAITSYQGGHLEYFKYMLDLLRAGGGADIKVFGGGGGVIVADEIRELHDYGVARVYSPEDGAVMGLQGIFDGILDVHVIAPYCKPMPGSFQLALQAAGSPDPHACVLIDDQARITRAAQELGFYTVLVGRDGPGPDADASLSRLIDLPSLLRGAA